MSILTMFKSADGDWSWTRIMATYVILHTLLLWTYECVLVEPRNVTAEEVALIIGCLTAKGIQRFAEGKNVITPL